MPMNYTGSYAIVTGSSEGLGLYISKSLLEDFPGLEVIGLSRSKSVLDSDRFTWIQCDVTKPESLENCFKTIKTSFSKKTCSILINNAGMSKQLPILSETEPKTSCDVFKDINTFRSMMDVNLIGYTMITRLGVELMDHEQSGNIINVNSMAAHCVSEFNPFHFYHITKHAVNCLTECVRIELRSINSKIRVGQVSPGVIETGFFDNCGMFQKKDEKESEEELSKKITGAFGYNALLSEDVYAGIKIMITAEPRSQIGDIQIRPTASKD